MRGSVLSSRGTTHVNNLFDFVRGFVFFLMFEKKISKLFFGDQIISSCVRADGVAWNRRDGDHIVDASNTRIGNIIDDISRDQTG